LVTLLRTLQFPNQPLQNTWFNLSTASARAITAEIPPVQPLWLPGKPAANLVYDPPQQTIWDVISVNEERADWTLNDLLLWMKQYLQEYQILCVSAGKALVYGRTYQHHQERKPKRLRELLDITAFHRDHSGRRYALFFFILELDNETEVEIPPVCCYLPEDS